MMKKNRIQGLFDGALRDLHHRSNIQLENVPAGPSIEERVADVDRPKRAKHGRRYVEPSARELQRIRMGPRGRGAAEGFAYWCRKYVWIEDKATHRAMRFSPYKSQSELGRRLARGEWLWILKARRIGLTTLLRAYAVWRTVFFKMRRVLILNQDKFYAQEFLQGCRFMLDALPAWQRPERTQDSRDVLEFNNNGHGGKIVSLACTRNAIRSLDADLVILDEAAYMRYLTDVLRASEPALEASGGQCVGLSTSNGPAGRFHDVWQGSISAHLKRSRKTSRFYPIFFSWREHPGRNEQWYDEEQAKHADDPLYMKREYPAAPDEAWESAEGRIYPLFARDRRFVRSMKINRDWIKYRAVDWGGVDPFVCLWLCIVPGVGAGFSVNPSCTQLMRELVAYRWGEHEHPVDVDNHGPDALRYAVITFGRDGLRGHVHVYRECYVEHSASKGLSPADLAHRVKALSGSEHFMGTVADRSRPDSITLFSQLGIPTRAHRRLRGERRGEIVQGIARMAALIAATAKQDSSVALPARHSSTRLPRGGLPLEGLSGALSFRGCSARHHSRPIFG